MRLGENLKFTLNPTLIEIKQLILLDQYNNSQSIYNLYIKHTKNILMTKPLPKFL